jgi:2-oxoglutarate ferredoxin oxidoreductase subunit alpha
VAREQGLDVSQVHLRHLNPLPGNLEEVLRRFERVVVPEMNSGQLSTILRAKYLVPAEGFNKIQGKPFRVDEILERIRLTLAGGV